MRNQLKMMLLVFGFAFVCLATVSAQASGFAALAGTTENQSGISIVPKAELGTLMVFFHE